MDTNAERLARGEVVAGPATEDTDRVAAEIMDEADATDLQSELVSLLNRFSRENVSNTPDHILRDYMWTCLKAFEAGVKARDRWYGIDPSPGQS